MEAEATQEPLNEQQSKCDCSEHSRPCGIRTRDSSGSRTCCSRCMLFSITIRARHSQSPSLSLSLNIRQACQCLCESAEIEKKMINGCQKRRGGSRVGSG